MFLARIDLRRSQLTRALLGYYKSLYVIGEGKYPNPFPLKGGGKKTNREIHVNFIDYRERVTERLKPNRRTIESFPSLPSPKYNIIKA